MKNIFTSWNKDRSKLNILIDTLMLVLMSMVAGLGFLIKYVLLPGFKRIDVYGPSTELTFLNMDRHQWGNIHLILSICLVVFVIIHILLHWNMIVCIYRKLIPGKSTRNLVSTGILVVCFFLFSSPFFIKPEQHYQEPGYRNRLSAIDIPNNTYQAKKTTENTKSSSITTSMNSSPGDNKTTTHKQHSRQEHSFENIEIYGSMTIEEVCGKYNVKVNDLVTRLQIPENKAEYHLGWLRKRYHFEMNDVRAAVLSLQKETKSLH